MDGARATWTNERLDDLVRRMDDGFKRVDADIRSLGFELSNRMDRLEDRMDRFEARMDALQRTILQVGGGMTGAILVFALSLVATHF
jgi:hypothetical protein